MKTIRKRVMESYMERLVGRVQKKLHMFPSPRLMVQVDSLDSDGNVTERLEFKSNSFVRNAYNVVAFQIGAFQSYKVGYGDGMNSLKDLTATIRNLGASTSDTNESASVCRVGNTSSSSYLVDASFLNSGGIIVGTSESAESIDDFALGMEIVQGTGAGQLTYATMDQVTNGEWDPTGRLVSSQFSRTVTNSSGADITVKEIGMKNKVKTGATGQVFDFLWARDVLPTPVTIANGESKTFTYILRFPF